MGVQENDAAGAYHMAQRALSDLKAAIHRLLGSAPEGGLTNSELGRALGIYQGHVGHEGHIPRTLLAIMESEGVVEQDVETKRWRLRPVGKSECTEGESSGSIPVEG